LAFGKTHFKDFARSPERIASNILADRLVKLAGAGLLEKRPSPDSPARDTYRLTPKGETLLPVLQAVAAWGLANFEGTAALMRPLARRG